MRNEKKKLRLQRKSAKRLTVQREINELDQRCDDETLLLVVDAF